MSVINQMLKDLDKRQEDNPSATHIPVPISTAKSNTPLAVFFTVLVTLILVALAYLYTENQSLKSQSLASASDAVNNISVSNQNDVTSSITPPTSQESDKQAPLDNQILKEQPNEPNNHAAEQVTESIPKHLVSPTSERITNSKDVASSQIVVDKMPVTDNSEAVDTKSAIEAKQTLSISRKKLSPQALAEKKMTQAKQAVIDSDMPLAEKLFEDVLLISPSHLAARKQLAALLYGRQSLQEAINLLANGIKLTPQDSELRIMLAKIYSERGFQQQAFATLAEVPETSNVEYQSLLATTAQSLKQHQYAKEAYLRLIQLQGNEGRWLLGLAISYDSLGQYSEAYSTYNKATEAGGLSVSATNFAKQRKLELGEQ
ncbi:tetratricopeptide repeat protein [Thalassotalea atypica]|uniref:tetratricopeptide repeat protein n=1 Tax=Thalassotalea atypica TaxID=2054316 RepID=UPI00257447CE|nr:tetratricopeptide repeat protein [Thalassotalea atypica]